MGPAHTTSPWRLERFKDPSGVTQGLMVVQDTGKEKEVEKLIARIEEWGGLPEQRPETNANARMLASAPALFAALFQLTQETTEYVLDPKTFGADAQRIVLAIVKARAAMNGAVKL